MLTDTARRRAATTLSGFGRFLTLIQRRLQLGFLRDKNADSLNVNLDRQQSISENPSASVGNLLHSHLKQICGKQLLKNKLKMP